MALYLFRYSDRDRTRFQTQFPIAVGAIWPKLIESQLNRDG